MTVTSGRKWLGSLKLSGPLGSLARMLLGSSRWHSTVVFLTWSALGTPAKRSLYRLVPLTPRTVETGSGLWATPQARDGTPRGAQAERFLNKERSNDLPDQVAAVAKGLWPTPKAHEDRGERYRMDTSFRHWTEGRQVSLSQVVRDQRMWPTPDTQNHRDGTKTRKDSNISTGGRHGVSLHHAVALWPTPSANEDAAGTPKGNMQGMLGNHPGVRGTTPEEWQRGSLNPQWVEWLMGYPAGWTDLGDSATPSSRRSSRKSGGP